jgi:hypothetical protein
VSPRAASADPRLEALLAAAEEHGLESEPEDEVGDLQDLVRACWNRLGESDRQAVHREHAESCWGGP